MAMSTCATGAGRGSSWKDGIMTNILILGGSGMTGRLLARHLLEQSTAKIVLAARHLDKVESLAFKLNSQFGGSRVSAVYADAANAESLRTALSGMDIIIVAAPTTQHSDTVIRTTLECGVDYLDVQFSSRKLAVLKSFDADIKQSGRCFITEAGFHPGLPSAMVRYAALHLDGITSATTAGFLNMGGDLPYTEAVDELMEAFKDYHTDVYREGKWIASGGFKSRKIDFGEGIGVRACYPMFFEELRNLPAMYPTLEDAGFYISGTNRLVDWIVTPLVMAGLKIAPAKSIKPMGKLMWWGMRKSAKPPYVVLLKVDAEGAKEGKHAAFTATVSHQDAYELTAIPVVAALLQYLDGSARKPGLWMMGHIVEPIRLFKDMEKMGVAVRRSVEIKN